MTPAKRAIEILRADSLIVLVIGLYVWAGFVAPEKAMAAALTGARTLGSVALIIVSVFGALGLFAVLVDKQAVGKRLGHGSGHWAILGAAAFGTVLVGPVYAVFPLLKAFRQHGARWAVIGTIITAWAVKIPMIPLEIRFLGWQFSLARTVFTLVMAIVLGYVLERIMGSVEPPA